MFILRFIVVCCVAVMLFLACKESSPIYDSIYYGGVIIPMTGENIRYDALATSEGKIVAHGSLDILSKHADSSTKMIDLQGATLIPGFIDGHSHIMMGMEGINHVNLSSPPVSDITNIDQLVQKLKDKKISEQIPDGEWIQGWGYDPDLLDEKRHPTKYDLDKAFPNNPVFLLHVSGHLASINSKALELAGITAESPEPEGGQFMRNLNTKEPNGVLAESALAILRQVLPPLDSSIQMDNLKKVMSLYASNGITTANDGYSTIQYIDLLKAASAKSKLPIDVISLVGFQFLDKYLGDQSFIWNTYNNGLKFGGIKIVADGSPQGKTARMKEPYLTEVHGCAHDCRGISIVNQEQLDQLVNTIYQSGVQLFIHCNGDEAIDMLLSSHKKSIEQNKLDSKSLRTVVIHSQFMHPDLIDAYALYGIIPSYFTNHTFFWGDVHVANMGVERAYFTSPLKSSLDARLTFSNHSDYPITPLDPLFIVWSAVNRQSRSGEVIGAKERISTYEALKALTINAAFQYHEEDTKGTLEIGKMADMVILSSDPLSIDPLDLRKIFVLKTIKEGEVIYPRE